MENSSQLPVGKITFLFTDIVGSTKLWEQHPIHMKRALARHDNILNVLFQESGGKVFKTVGDAFCVAFTSPVDAVRAAVAAQRALLHEDWGATPIQVRMGIHSGDAEKRNGDYFGPPLNRVARLMAAGHGRQVLVSQATSKLIHDRLPAGIALRDMGRHSLKDFPQPERIYQIIAEGLPVEFPALNVQDARHHNLPAQVTPFIGREAELEEITDLISPFPISNNQVRLLTLTGPGGTGKTRLALQVASRLLDVFEDGVYFVDLSTIKDPTLVLPAIERVLSLREAHDQSSLETIAKHLHDKQLLLVLDNFEQVIPAGDDIAQLLSRDPGLTLLVTSRISLRIYGEVGYDVPSLEVPDTNDLLPPEKVAQYESIRLFCHHARATKSDFKINRANAAAIVEICRRLDGLPLAIELAAVHIRLLTPQQILNQLENRLPFLGGGPRNRPDRQRTLRGAIDWSYDLLEPQQKLLFMRLGVFAGGFTYEAAEAVCNQPDDIEVLVSLEKLINHSLLSQVDTDDVSRFVMLQTIHAYAFNLLQNSGDLDRLRSYHLAFYAQLAEEAQQFLELAEQSTWLDQLERDNDNLSAALHTAIDFQKLEQGFHMAQALRLFWFSRGYHSEGQKLVADLLSLPMPPKRRFQLLDTAGFLARYHGDFAAAESYVSEALSIVRKLGDQQAFADALASAGFIYLHQNQLEQAQEAYTEALRIYQDRANEQGTADATIHLGLIAFYREDNSLAQSHYQKSLAIWQRLGDTQGIAYAQYLLGDIAYEKGDIHTAESHFRDSLRNAADIGFQMVIAASLEGLARVAVDQNSSRRALVLAGAAAEIRKNSQVPAIVAGSRLNEQALASARKMLSEDAATVAWNDGRTLSPDEAARFALGI